jgi:succinyl-CoA synthetase beta subunit
MTRRWRFRRSICNSPVTSSSAPASRGNLRAYRDVPAVKQDSVALVLVKLAQMTADIPEIRELDINPLLANENGVLAVDARVAVGPAARKFAGSGLANFAVRHIRRNGSATSR